MRKILCTLSAAVLLVACGGGETKKESTETTTAAPENKLSDNPDYSKGLALVAGSDLLTLKDVLSTCT